ncbi:MAG: LytTR family transcriptional regulator [Bacteroidales bacterium]|jgi:DNA-binding LytR/AlgR family response regulator|nr:LytTR family transcriptional regulator [Bacteroidales bacterium]
MKELIFSNSGTELLKVHPEDIIYIEADGNYCRMHLRGGFEQQLWFNRQRFISIISSQLRDEKPTFIVVGRSFIINLAYIFRINPVQSELVLFDSVKPEQMSLHASQEALNKLKKEILILNKVEDYER